MAPRTSSITLRLQEARHVKLLYKYSYVDAVRSSSSNGIVRLFLRWVAAAAAPPRPQSTAMIGAGRSHNAMLRSCPRSWGETTSAAASVAREALDSARAVERYEILTVPKFVVSASQESGGSFPLFGGPVVVAAAATLFQVSSGGARLATLTSTFLLAIFLLNRIRKQREESACEATITVYPIGVQLARVKNSRPVRPPLFIPRDVILDVIVTEVILAHRVVSVVFFRVFKRDEKQASDSAQPPISTLLKEGRIHLVPAFPGVELSFSECQLMRREVSASLGIV